MSTFPQRVRDNILPLSVAGTLPEAFEEWTFTEHTHDLGAPVETCQLCEQEDLRYHFQIRNSLTDNELWVGSQCILKFGVSVFEEGRRLSDAEAKKKLNRLIRQMHVDSCVKALERVAASEVNPILSNALAFYRTNKYLTPKFAFVVLWKLGHFGVNHNPSFFTVNLQKDKYKTDLREMPLARVHMIWPALTTAQRVLAQRLGHSPPPRSDV